MLDHKIESINLKDWGHVEKNGIKQRSFKTMRLKLEINLGN